MRLTWPRDFQTLANDRVAKGFSVIQIIAGLYPPGSRLPPERDGHRSQITTAVAQPPQTETVVFNLQPIRSRVNHSDLLAEPILSRQNREVVGQFELRRPGCYVDVVTVPQSDYRARQEGLSILQLHAVADPAPGVLDSPRVLQ